MGKKKSLSELDRLSVADFRAAPKVPLSLFLDDIRSANNVGSIFRTADCFALQHLYLCGITPRPPHRDILKTALGATGSISWSYHEDILLAITQVQADEGMSIFGLEQAEGSVPLRRVQLKPNKPVGLIVGNEVNGVRQEAIDLCNGCIEIEQYGTKHSLNVAVATGLAAYELSGQLRARAPE